MVQSSASALAELKSAVSAKKARRGLFELFVVTKPLQLGLNENKGLHSLLISFEPPRPFPSVAAARQHQLLLKEPDDTLQLLATAQGSRLSRNSESHWSCPANIPLRATCLGMQTTSARTEPVT